MFSSDRYIETDKSRGEKERGGEGGRKGERDTGVGEETLLTSSNLSPKVPIFKYCPNSGLNSNVL